MGAFFFCFGGGSADQHDNVLGGDVHVLADARSAVRPDGILAGLAVALKPRQTRSLRELGRQRPAAQQIKKKK